jgi:hypothetical protein
MISKFDEKINQSNFTILPHFAFRECSQQSVHWSGGTRCHFQAFSGFGFSLLPSRVHAGPPASNANRSTISGQAVRTLKRQFATET